MSKLFVETIIQHGGDLSDADKVAVLNIVAEYINKKMKKLECKYEIKLKLEKLPVNNTDCLPQKIGIVGTAQIDGPFKGSIPYYTNTEIAVPTPTISTITTGVQLSSYGPVVGVPTLAINPFGNINRLDERIKKATETLEILVKLNEELKNDIKINDANPLKKYFIYDKFDEEELVEKIQNILN